MKTMLIVILFVVGFVQWMQYASETPMDKATRQKRKAAEERAREEYKKAKAREFACASGCISYSIRLIREEDTNVGLTLSMMGNANNAPDPRYCTLLCKGKEKEKFNPEAFDDQQKLIMDCMTLSTRTKTYLAAVIGCQQMNIRKSDRMECTNEDELQRAYDELKDKYDKFCNSIFILFNSI